MREKLVFGEILQGGVIYSKATLPIAKSKSKKVGLVYDSNLEVCRNECFQCTYLMNYKKFENFSKYLNFLPCLENRSLKIQIV